MRHLFLAPLASAYGEALHALRIARALVDSGDSVVMLAPAAMHAVIGESVQFGRIDMALATLDQQFDRLVERLGVGSVVLVDLAAVDKVARAFKLDLTAFTRPRVPVVAALDCWHLPASGPIVWEYGQYAERSSDEIHQVTRRLVPVPIARPDAVGAFRALPEVEPASTREREDVRAGLGLRADAKLVVWPTAGWQHGANHPDVKLGALADVLPELILPVLDARGSDVHIIHVGPFAFPHGLRHASRYHFVGQLAPAQFERVVASADVLLGFNSAATSLGTAIAARTPIVLGQSSTPITSLDDAAARLGRRFTERVRGALEPSLPLAPVHAWPLRLGGVLAPVLADNPLRDALLACEVFDEHSLVSALDEALGDTAAVRAREDAYADAIAALPAGHELLRTLIAS